MSSTSSKKPTSATSKAKTTKAKAPIKKVPSPAEVAPKPMLASASPASTASSPIASPVLKKQELIEKVVRASGIKKKDAKPVVEAMLEVMGDALADGREFNLQPLGKLKLNRTKETEGARIIVAKIRQSKSARSNNDTAKPILTTVAE